jgi:hypothetical protein
MQKSCELIQDQLMDLLDEANKGNPRLQVHLRECTDCRNAFQSYQDVQNLYKSLPDREPSIELADRVLSRVSEAGSPQVGVLAWVSRVWLHPATVAAFVFVLTLGGTLLFKRFYPFSTPQNQVAVNEKTAEIGPAGPVKEMKGEEGLSVQPMALNPNFRMVDWNPVPRLIPDLDRPVLRHTDVASLEQASIESVAVFKHQIALRHILDGEYAKASQVLDGVIDNYLNYSHWDQAVLLHISVMKKLGRQDEIRRDLNRLREYAMTNPELISQAEREIQ